MPATDQIWRPLGTMHKVFAASAVILLGATLLMMAKDESREWRVYQSRAEDLKVARLERQKQDFATATYRAAVDGLQAKIAEAKQKYDTALADHADLVERRDALAAQIQIASTTSKFTNAVRDVERSKRDLGVRDDVPEAQDEHLLAAFELGQQEADARAREVERMKIEFDGIKGQLAAFGEDLTSLEAEKVKLEASERALLEQIEAITPSNPAIAFKRSMKEWPIINGFNPHLKIQYDWPKGLEQQLGMARVDRVDRCRSCHVNINDFTPAMLANYEHGHFDDGKYPHPFASHPNGRLFLSDSSPHPINKFGCTICHEGDGSGTSFQSAEHSPSTPGQSEAWRDEHHWHSNHFWESPMHPQQFTESSCLRCHHQVVELGVNAEYGNSAPQLFEGFNLIREYGCFGCHEIHGYDAGRPIGPDLRLEPQTADEASKIAADPTAVAGLMRKVGPSLRHLKQKVTPEFAASWTANPQEFRPETRMPRFFQLWDQYTSHESDHAGMKLQPAELQAVAAFLMKQSQDLELLQPKEGYQPDVERGRKLFTRRGCLACHQNKGEGDLSDVTADFGPDLSRIHEKLLPGKAGFDWLYTWIKEPERYHARTKMPDLYLDPYVENGVEVDPAADIATYLLSKGNPTEFPKFAGPTPYLGATFDEDFTAEEAAALGVQHQGVRILSVIPGSAASRARATADEGGKAMAPLSINDVILKVGSSGATSAAAIDAAFAASRPGEAITLTVIPAAGPDKGQTVTREVLASTPLDDLVRLFLSKAVNSEKLEEAMAGRKFPLPAEAYADPAKIAAYVKGDEVELVGAGPDENLSDEAWEQRKLNYVGRKTVSRYGCYGCHDIPGFEEARPIGVALQDWGRKDTGKLALEHIEEFLHHHGEPDGSSTAERMERVVKLQLGGEEVSPADDAASHMYESLHHHGRSGFLWQKLRQPRSYDFKKIETKGYDERLKMPKFPFNEKQIESIATFVLGLVADPPPTSFQYRPTGPKAAIIEGERLLEKYNCGGCHILDLPEVTYKTTYDDFFAPGIGEKNHQAALDLLLKLKPARHFEVKKDPQTGEPLGAAEHTISFHGTVRLPPDLEAPPEEQEYTFATWESVQFGEKLLLPADNVNALVPNIVSMTNGRGGALTHWLLPRIREDETKGDLDRAWQASPPVLYREGLKVQTPWLYQFLKNPEQLRYTTVLRMPKFNMDDAEAQSLADYFAAVDGVPYPYQSIPQQLEPVKQAKQAWLQSAHPDAQDDYQTISWKAFNGPECRKCHALGGKPYVSTDPKNDIRGPNLDRVSKRLRPDFAQLWVYQPRWVLPYTSMPAVFPKDQTKYTDLLGGVGQEQAEAIVNALMNYQSLMEAHGQVDYKPPEAPMAPAAGAEAPAGGEAPAAEAEAAAAATPEPTK